MSTHENELQFEVWELKAQNTQLKKELENQKIILHTSISERDRENEQLKKENEALKKSLHWERNRSDRAYVCLASQGAEPIAEICGGCYACLLAQSIHSESNQMSDTYLRERKEGER